MSKKKKRVNRSSQELRSDINGQLYHFSDDDEKTEKLARNTENAGQKDTEVKNNPRVVDLSWAAEYIDDEWEDSYKKAGKFDTRIIEPLPVGSYDDDERTPVMFDLMADSRKKLEAAEVSFDDEITESIGLKTTTAGEDKPESPLAVTQEYKSDSTESEFSKNLKAAIRELENKDAETKAQMALENGEENRHEEDFDDVLKIRDAETDKTIFSVEDARLVREAAANMDLGDDLDDIAKIRDAETNKTIVSIEDARLVREAAANLDICDDLDEIVKIRDAETDKTIYSVEDARLVRDAVSQMSARDKMFTAEKIRDAETDKTIVSIEDAIEVRNAARAIETDDEPTLPLSRRRNIFHIDADGEMDAFISMSESPKNEVEEIDASVNAEDAADATVIEEVEKTRKIDIAKIKSKAFGRNRKKKKESIPANKPESFDVEDFLNINASESCDVDSLLEGIVVDKTPKKRTAEKRSESRKRQQTVPAGRQAYRDDYYDEYSYNYSDDDYDYDRDEYYYDDREYRSRRNDSRPRGNNRRRNEGAYYVESKSPLRFIPLFLVIAVCVLAFITAKEVCFDTPVNSSDYSKYTYTINGGVKTADLAEDLYNMGLIENTLVFRLRALFYGLDCQDGTYVLSPCYSTEKIVNILSGYEYIDE